MRISAAQRIQNENRIRAAMDRLLRGEIPPGGNCDVKTLAREAGVDRTAFYGNRPYAHLRIEFEHRLQQLQRDGHTPDPKARRSNGCSRGRQAQNPSRPGEFDDRGTHRLPNPGPGPARRPTRRDPPSPRRRRPEYERCPPPARDRRRLSAHADAAQHRDLGHNRRSLITTHSATSVASHAREIVLVKRNTNLSEHGLCGDKAHRGVSDGARPAEADDLCAVGARPRPFVHHPALSEPGDRGCGRRAAGVSRPAT